MISLYILSYHIRSIRYINSSIFLSFLYTKIGDFVVLFFSHYLLNQNSNLEKHIEIAVSWERLWIREQSPSLTSYVMFIDCVYIGRVLGAIISTSAELSYFISFHLGDHPATYYYGFVYVDI